MSLKKLRQKIDAIDGKLISLLNQRASEAKKVSKLKNEKGMSTYSPEREADIIRRLQGLNKGPFTSGDMGNVFSEILSVCRKQGRVLKLAYLGPETTFTHIAALKKFGKSSRYIKCKSIANVFSEVEAGRADYGVVPIENSTEGAINHTLDMFVDSSLKICSEVYVPIKLNLMAKVKDINSVKRIFSRPEAVAQCSNWIENNLSCTSIEPTSSTAAAVSRVAHPGTSDLNIKPIKGEAAIASSLAAKEHKLNILASSIEDSHNNITRFLVIGKQEAKSTKHDKTSIVFSMKDKSGALHDVLAPFKKGKINLTKIESRPSKKKAWKYYFFVDFQGHKDSKVIQNALRQLGKVCIFIKVLGSYPREN